MHLRLRSSWIALSLLLAAGCPAEEENTDTQSNSGDPSTGADSSAGDDSAALGCAFPEVIDTTDGMMTPLQDKWGAPCSTAADCVALLGEGAECLDTAVVFELPGGYCSKPCALPDSNTRFVMDDPACDPMGGVACVGSQAGMFEHCAPLCTDDAQCNRDGYICRQMPYIAFPEDPTLCLMPDCCEGTCDPND